MSNAKEDYCEPGENRTSPKRAMGGKTMADKQHRYAVQVKWTGNNGTGTHTYRGYKRAHDISAVGKATIAGSSDPAFLGDGTRWNPEELLVASLSACHKLWYLGLCAQAGIAVTAYEDAAQGTMAEDASGAGRFTSVTLHPRVMLAADADESKDRASSPGSCDVLHRAVGELPRDLPADGRPGARLSKKKAARPRAPHLGRPDLPNQACLASRLTLRSARSVMFSSVS
jgi:organic hydroperoxide reductase OsmC/OhrA